ncbi:MAG: acetamidase/formamidase family protein [Candidatus Competibacterales bacterium]
MNSAVYPLALAAAVGAAAALADTSEVKTLDRVVIAKQGDHCADDPNCFNRFHPAIPAAVTARPGQHLVFETRDALDSDLGIDSVPEDLAALDLTLVHPMTGPVAIEGAERGDVLAVTLVDIEPDEYGYTVIIPGTSFLRDRFTEPFIANWRLDRLEATSEQIPGVAIPFNGFMGSVGVLPGEPELENILAREQQLQEVGGVVLTPEPAGALPKEICGPEGSHKDSCLRTIPPRENGGNLDVKQMQVGTTVLLPCFVDGCGLFVGDVHFAQGDGEVSGTPNEMGARVTVVTEVRKGGGELVKVPHFEGGEQLKKLAPSAFYATTGFPLKEAGEVPPHLAYLDSEELPPLENLSEDLAQAARNALIEMLDYMVATYDLTPEQALVVASVAVDLRIGQLVDVPNYTVSAILPLTIFR